MPKVYKLILMLALLIVVALTSGCYTMVGYPLGVEEGIIEEGTTQGRIYRDYDYYYDRPYSYYGNYYDPYYGLYSPYSSYWNYSGRYYDDRYYWDYDDHYVPQKKPETKHRGAFGPRRAPGPEPKHGSRLEEDEGKNAPRREIGGRQKAESRTQRPIRRKRSDSTSGSQKRSTKEKSQDEEK